MLSICPDAQIIDIAHSVRKFAVGDGAFILSTALPFMPAGVHLAVVDPGVGTERRPVALRVARGDTLVGPDNGLLLLGAEALGGVTDARELDNQGLWLGPTTSTTFHGRDIFAPVAARLAAGSADFEEVGSRVEIDSLVALPQAVAEVGEGWIKTEVIYVDTFGNLRLAGGARELVQALGDLAHDRPLRVEVDDPAGRGPRVEEARFAETFGAVPGGAEIAHVERCVVRASLAPRLLGECGPCAGPGCRTEQATATEQHRSPDEAASRYCTRRSGIGGRTGHRLGGPAALLPPVPA